MITDRLLFLNVTSQSTAFKMLLELLQSADGGALSQPELGLVPMRTNINSPVYTLHLTLHPPCDRHSTALRLPTTWPG